jgi:hypothetical protein
MTAGLNTCRKISRSEDDEGEGDELLLLDEDPFEEVLDEGALE